MSWNTDAMARLWWDPSAPEGYGDHRLQTAALSMLYALAVSGRTRAVLVRQAGTTVDQWRVFTTTQAPPHATGMPLEVARFPAPVGAFLAVRGLTQTARGEDPDAAACTISQAGLDMIARLAAAGAAAFKGQEGDAP